jgi:hypothetical protein
MMRHTLSHHSRRLQILLLILVCLETPETYAQRERELPPAQDSDYGVRFFDQLRTIFGRFRDMDLKRVFQMARPIQCGELVTDKGEWKEVAFFNENRKLGDWYRTSLDEVKSELAVYVFKGACGGQHAAVQLTTKFPVDESLKSYQAGRIPFRNIDINVNSPVTATYDAQSQIYTFDLPYLFRSTNNGEPIYTLNPPRLSDRYATDVMNRWECKSVNADDVTYKFLICHTTLVPRNAGPDSSRTVPFGASAYSILSDGREAYSSVKLSFGAADSTAKSPDTPTPEQQPTPDQSPAQARAWRASASQARLVEIGQSEFRLRFNEETWKGKIGRPQLVANGVLSDMGTPFTPPRGKDYCAWRPRMPAQVNQLLDSSRIDSILQSLEFKKEVQSGMSAIFEMQNDAGMALGALQCFFLSSQTPTELTAGRLLSIVGSSIGLEVPGQ